MLTSCDNIESVIGRLDELQGKYIRVNIQVRQKIGAQKKDVIDSYDPSCNSRIKLEPMKMPTFNGQIREYPRFRRDFEMQVIPSVKSADSAAYILKSCLFEEPHDIVKSVDDDVRETWNRLDERYGRSSKLADAVMFDIKQLKVLSDGDDKKFLDLVNVIEKGYRDLKRANMEHELSNTTIVSLIEEKLPKLIKRKWYMAVSKKDSKVNERNKFPDLLEFLLEQKRCIEYGLEDLRSRPHVQYGKTHHIDGRDSVEETKRGGRCMIHNTVDHSTENCRGYIDKTPEEKAEIMKELKACWCCLQKGHFANRCYYKTECGVDGCKRMHHKSLHKALAILGIQLHSQSKQMSSSKHCLLQLMKVKCGTGRDVNLNTLWDGGSTLSMITFKKASEMQLKGEKVALTIIKVGGEREDIRSYLYEVPLKDADGHIVHFCAYGIKKISTEIEKIDVGIVKHLFVDINENILERPGGEVDMLIGFEYAGFHPIRMQAADHLLLMKNRFGWCLGGSHEKIEEKVKIVADAVVYFVKGSCRPDKFYHTEELGVEVRGRCNGCDCGGCECRFGCNHENLYARREKEVKKKGVVVCHTKGSSDVNDFLQTEELGIEVIPRCGGCKCRECPSGGKQYSLKEERELMMIEEGLKIDNKQWTATYPWKRNPCDLPNNYSAHVLC